MSKWIRLKVALLTAAATLSALQLGGCIGGSNMMEKVMQYVAIGSIFD